jgi:hypothetical protein
MRVVSYCLLIICLILNNSAQARERHVYLQDFVHNWAIEDMIKAMLKNRRSYMRRQGFFELEDSRISGGDGDLMDIDNSGMDVDGNGNGYEGDGGDEENSNDGEAMEGIHV